MKQERELAPEVDKILNKALKKLTEHAWKGNKGPGTPILVGYKQNDDRNPYRYGVIRIVALSRSGKKQLTTLNHGLTGLIIDSQAFSGIINWDKRISPYNGHVSQLEYFPRAHSTGWNKSTSLVFTAPGQKIPEIAKTEGIDLAQVDGGVSHADLESIAKRFFNTSPSLPISIPQWIDLFGWHSIEPLVQEGQAYKHRVSWAWDESTYEPGYGCTSIGSYTNKYYIYLGQSQWGVIRERQRPTVRYLGEDDDDDDYGVYDYDYEKKVLGITSVDQLDKNKFSAVTPEQEEYLLSLVR